MVQRPRVSTPSTLLLEAYEKLEKLGLPSRFSSSFRLGLLEAGMAVLVPL